MKDTEVVAYRRVGDGAHLTPITGGEPIIGDAAMDIVQSSDYTVHQGDGRRGFNTVIINGQSGDIASVLENTGEISQIKRRIRKICGEKKRVVIVVH